MREVYQWYCSNVRKTKPVWGKTVVVNHRDSKRAPSWHFMADHAWRTRSHVSCEPGCWLYLCLSWSLIPWVLCFLLQSKLIFTLSVQDRYLPFSTDSDCWSYGSYLFYCPILFVAYSIFYTIPFWIRKKYRKSLWRNIWPEVMSIKSIFNQHSWKITVFTFVSSH